MTGQTKSVPGRHFRFRSSVRRQHHLQSAVAKPEAVHQPLPADGVVVDAVHRRLGRLGGIRDGRHPRLVVVVGGVSVGPDATVLLEPATDDRNAVQVSILLISIWTEKGFGQISIWTEISIFWTNFHLDRNFHFLDKFPFGKISIFH
jgi:hypothetical protein